MIIEEKGLVKAIKAAYRHSGYTVLNQGGEVTIYTEGWFVRCLWTKLPRKALAIIVEHMGMIPDDGEAMAIEKDDQPQAVMAGIVSDDVAGWMGGEAASMASYVPVTFRGYQLDVYKRQGGGQDQPLYIGAFRVYMLHHGDAEGESLARTGGRLGNHIFPLHKVGDGAGLDRRGLDIALFPDCLHYSLRETQVRIIGELLHLLAIDFHHSRSFLSLCPIQGPHPSEHTSGTPFSPARP